MNIKIKKINKRRWLLILVDSLITFFICIGTQLLHSIGLISFSFKSAPFSPMSWLAVGIVLSVQLISRLFFGIYSYIWRYVGIRNYLYLVLSDFITGLILVAISFLFNIGFGFIGTLIIILMACLTSLIIRFIYQEWYAFKSTKEDLSEENMSHRINIVIVGAGNIGASLAEELLRNPKAHYRPLFFIDNDPVKIGLKIHGLQIYPVNDKTIDIIKSSAAQEIVIALPDLSGDERESLYNFYEKTNCKIKLYDYPIKRKENSKREVREFNTEDVLFRVPLHLENKKVKNYYNGKIILVTGGGGSIGSELCREIADMNPARLIIFDIYENNAYEIQQEIFRRHGSDFPLNVLIGSVRDQSRMEEVFSTYHPDIVIHAAAHKHVPLMEDSPSEAIKNNVFGTYITANMAEKYGASRFVLISTDKAVNPTNIMGASKRLCEMIIQCRQDSKTSFVAVRFGNVLGSNGSVIPLFKRQIEEGGPVTITDKRIIRYFMTIPEAANLVLEAGAMAKHGELFVLDMGKPVHIYDLARNLIKLSGLIPNVDIEIKEIGLRPGEKLYEELLIKSEHLEKTESSMIFVEKDVPITRLEVEKKLNILSNALIDKSRESIINAMKMTVDTYRSPKEVNKIAESAPEIREANF